MADLIKRPVLGEISEDKQGSLYTDMLIQNEDSILNTRGGGDLAIYTEVLRDDQVKSTLEQRRRAVVSAEWAVFPASESALDKTAAEFIKLQFQRFSFDRKSELMLYAMFYGYGVGEFIYGQEGNRLVLDDIKVRDRSNFRLGKDGKIYKISMAHPMGERMPDNKFWWFSIGADHDENPYGLGLAHWLYWPVFFKRNGLKYWSVFLEKFAQPTPTATLPQSQINDSTMKRRALEALQAIQVDSGVLIPEGIEIALLEAARSGSGDYESQRRALDQAISKIVLSQTMTTDSGSSRSQAEVHNDVKEDVVKADADLICESLNNTVVTWLTKWNFPGANPPKIWRNTEPPADLKQRVEVDKGIYALGYEPTEEYIKETYGEGWVKRKTVSDDTETDWNNNQLIPQFAENAPLADKRNGRRADIAGLVASAEVIAHSSNDVLGKRVRELMAYAEQAEDMESFRERLNEMLADGPNEQSVSAVRDANIAARLMGNLRAER